MKKIIGTILIVVLLVIGLKINNTVDLQSGYYQNDTTNFMNQMWIEINDDNTFNLLPSPLSYQFIYGTYKIQEDRLILNNDTTLDTLVFLITDETTIRFINNESSQSLLNLEDGIELVLKEK